MEYKSLSFDPAKNDHLNHLMHPYLMIDVYQNLVKSEHLNSFIKQNDEVSAWFVFSDYCLDDKNKPSNIMTFSIVALQEKEDFVKVGKVLKVLQSKDIKKSSSINPAFLKFISLLPIFNVSFSLPDNRNFIKAYGFDEVTFLKMRYESLEKYYHRASMSPLANSTDKSRLVDDLKNIQRKFNSKSINLSIFRDIEIVNAAVTSIFTLISTVHQKKDLKLFWVSDRDALLTFNKSNLSSPLIFTLINASYHSLSPKKNHLGFFNHIDNGKPELDHFNRIPDIVSGTLADMTPTTVSKEKFINVLKDYLTLNEKNYIAKLYFDSDQYGLGNIILERK
ncbi:MAG: hypothetical protein ACN6NW_15255 [Acinetobacter amyesii]|uniref:hypothetical protein n=1 Tax=Acinetobacter amyesii TaxID=2942470 RepID=UPI003D07EBF5